MSGIHESCSTEDWISAENDVEICAGYIDSSDPSWREIVRNELLEENREDSPISVSDDKYDQDFKESKIKSLTEAIGHAEELRRFALYHRYEELASSISRTNDLLCN